MSQTADLLQAIREDIKRELFDEVLSELQPIIQKRLYDNVFTFREAMAYRKISESTLRRMIANGEIPYFMQRGHYYFRQRDLDKQADELVKQSRKREGA